MYKYVIISLLDVTASDGKRNVKPNQKGIMGGLVAGTVVTPTTTIITSNEDQAMTIVFPCGKISKDGVCELANAASNQRKGPSAGLWALLILLFSFAVVLAEEEEITPDILSFETMHSAIDNLADIVPRDGEPTNHIIQVDNQIFGIVNFTIEMPDDLDKRWNEHSAPLGASWTNFAILQQQLLWGAWEPVSCVEINNSEIPQSVLLESRVVKRAMWDDGFDFRFASKRAYDLGAKVVSRVSVKSTQWFTVPANSMGQIWAQQMVVVQQQQRQKCRKKHYGKTGIKCGEWKGPYGGRLPVAGGQSYGWSTGWQNSNGNTCGRAS